MCDSLVARGARTIDGSTLFAKNSDRRGRECQPFVQVPAAYHARGSKLRCTHLEIDQVAETYRVMGHSPFWCWGFEHGVNEWGVAIGNHATWSREPLEAKPGLIGMDLVRLGLERGRTAREALEVIAALVELHGQGGSSFGAEGDDGYQNSFVLADGRSAWVLETTARNWAAREADGASATNALTLGAEWQIGSRDLERSALQQGFWTRQQRLDFKRAYALEAWPDYLTERRQAAACDRLAGPPLSVDSMKDWLRDHGGKALPPAADLATDDPTHYSVCMHADPVSTTTASLVGALPREPEKAPWPMWISFATPCTGVFIPVYLDGVLPACFASTGDADARSPSLWIAMRDLQERTAEDFASRLPVVQARWAELEAGIERERVALEEEVTSLYARGDRERGADRMTRFMTQTGADVLDASRQLLASM